MNGKTIAVDFDGVIHKYSKKWHDGTIYDDPVIGSDDALRMFHKLGYRIVIFTARPIAPIAKWMISHNLIFDEITNTKPIAVVYIDDNGIRFTNWHETVKSLFTLNII